GGWGGGGDGRHCGSRGGQGFVSVLSHESRNLRKSARVSLSAASCARAAHSAAFCRQYPIFCHMTVPPLEPAAFSISASRTNSPNARSLSRGEGLEFRRVG